MKTYHNYSASHADGYSVILFKTGLLIMALLCLSLFACAPKETLRRTELSPYEGTVTVEALKQSVGFGNARSIKALADVAISKQREPEGRLNGALGYKAPGKMRIDLFGPFGLTVTEILMTDSLLQLYVPSKNILYEWNSPEVAFTGLINDGFRYEMEDKGDTYILLAYKTDEQKPDVVARYFFDRTYLLNRSMRFYKDGSEVLRTEFDDFNGRIPQRTRVSISNGMIMDITLREPEFDSDIPDEYFRTIEHGDKQIKSFQEIFKHFAPAR